MVMPTPANGFPYQIIHRFSSTTPVWRGCIPGAVIYWAAERLLRNRCRVAIRSCSGIWQARISSPQTSCRDLLCLPAKPISPLTVSIPARSQTSPGHVRCCSGVWVCDTTFYNFGFLALPRIIQLSIADYGEISSETSPSNTDNTDFGWDTQRCPF